MKEMIKLVPMEISIVELISCIICWILVVFAVIFFVKVLKDDRTTRH